MNRRKQIAVKGFAVLLSFLVLSLVYLLFFNTGMRMFEDREQDRIFITNESMHKIEDIQIFIGEGILTEIEELMPGEKKEIEIDAVGRITLTAKALFHADFESVFYLNEKFPNIEYDPDIEEPIVIGQNTTASVRLCSREENTVIIKVEISVEEEFFKMGKKEESVRLEQGQCNEPEFTLEPLKKGVTPMSISLTSNEQGREIKKVLVIN